jgi:hypothetical protein
MEVPGFLSEKKHVHPLCVFWFKNHTGIHPFYKIMLQLKIEERVSTEPKGRGVKF